MNRHLNQAEISAVVAGEAVGDAGSDAAAHLKTCAICRQQVEQLENVLGHFRSSVRDWSDAHFSGPVAVQPRERLQPAMAYGFAVALIVLVFFAGHYSSTRPVAAPSGLESDTLLLKQVNADVSRSAPPGMDTLLGFSYADSVQR